MKLQETVTLITGGARMGQAISTALAQAGSHVAFTYRTSHDSVLQSAAAVEKTGQKALICQADLSSEADVRTIIPAVQSKFGRLDILINMASLYHRTPLAQLDGAAFDAQISADVKSAYLLALEAAPLMRRQGCGRIINFVDWIAASRRPQYKDYVPYYIAKTAVQGLTEALALELAPDILVNGIAPGPILPPDDLSAEEHDAVIRATPLQRWGGVEEIVKAVLFLIHTDFITGEVIRVDGGRHLK